MLRRMTLKMNRSAVQIKLGWRNFFDHLGNQSPSLSLYRGQPSFLWRAMVIYILMKLSIKRQGPGFYHHMRLPRSAGPELSSVFAFSSTPFFLPEAGQVMYWHHLFEPVGAIVLYLLTSISSLFFWAITLSIYHSQLMSKVNSWGKLDTTNLKLVNRKCLVTKDLFSVIKRSLSPKVFVTEISTIN